MLENLITFLNQWQTLAGAALGAAAPILFWFFIQVAKRAEKRKEDLLIVEKEIVLAIHNLTEVKRALVDFVETNLSNLLGLIKEADTANVRSGSRTYLPKFYVHKLDDRLKEIHGGGGYLDNELIGVIHLSNDYVEQIEDVRQQFEVTVRDAQMLAINRINEPKFHNSEYSENIRSYQRMLEQTVITKNLNTYFERLVRVHAITMEMSKRSLSPLMWRLKFGAHFRFFYRRDDYKEYLSKTSERIETYFEPSTKKQIEEFKKKFEDHT